MVESRSIVNGASPGPAPACHARASNSRLTRSSWRTWPQRKLRRKMPRVDGALTTLPRAQAAPPARNASASSMQSPPASAEATSVIILSPGLARPGASPRSRRCWTNWERPRCRAKVAGRSRPAFATKRWSSKAIWMRSGWLRDSVYWVLLLWVRFCVSKTIIPDSGELPFASSGGLSHAPVRWIGASGRSGYRPSSPRWLKLWRCSRPG